MGNNVFANFISEEGTVNGTSTINLTIKSRRVTLTNDSTTAALQFKFNAGEDYATLNPAETVSMEFTSRNVYLSGTAVPYRLWVAC